MGIQQQEEVAAGLGMFFGLWAAFFVLIPIGIMFVRFITRGVHEGLSAMFTPPPFAGRKSLSSQTRGYLYAQSPYGFIMDVAQAFCSVISCVLYIVVAYALVEPIWVTDVEDAFTVYFAIDFCIRLWLAQDSLSWYFSLVALLDFVTVAPMLTAWLIQAGNQYDTDVAQVVACIRVLRVARIFRVIRVIRSVGISSSYAFQRQVFVLVTTVLSLVFVCGGIYQVFEEQEWERQKAAGVTPLTAQPSFHRSVYYATVSVIGRPVVPFISTLTAVFMTVVVFLAATIIPTFVAELIRLWFDNATLERYTPNPEAPHVLVCGDTNVSRLRALTTQYFHKSRNPDMLTPVVVLAEAKPEGALRSFIDQYKHSGMVRYIRGSARRAPDLRRAGLSGACTAIVLNYRADKDAGAADTEALSTVMAIKNVKPDVRVLVQLARPRKRNHLKSVPGWHDGDKSIASACLGMTLVGLGTAVPGLPTLFTNLVRRGATLSGLRRAANGSVAGSTSILLSVLYYGDRAKPAAAEAVSALMAREAASRRPKTPLEEYASSIDQAIHEMPVTEGLAGRTFAAAARCAYLRYGITLLGATIPLNDDVCALMPGLPRTYRVQLFPSSTVLALGMRLYAVSNEPEDLERFRLETGGLHVGLLAKVVEGVQDRVTSAVAAFKPHHTGDEGGAGPVYYGGRGGGELESGAAITAPSSDGDTPAPTAAATAAGGPATWLHTHASFNEASYRHNRAAVTDLGVPWCFEGGLGGSGAGGDALTELMARLHIPHYHGHGGEEAPGVGGMMMMTRENGAPTECPHCTALAAAAASPSSSSSASASLPFPGSLLVGTGILNLDLGAAGEAAADDKAEGESEHRGSSGGEVLEASSRPSSPAPPAAAAEGPAAPSSAPSSSLELISSADVARRRQSFGDDGLGGIDDTDDITGTRGPLATTAPSVHHTGGIAATAQAAAKANMNSLAVRLALPVAAAGSDVEGLAAEAKYRPPAFSGHVLIAGASDSMGYLLRSIASMLTHARKERQAAAAARGAAAGGASGGSPAEDWVEGEQYSLLPGDVVVLAPAKPLDANVNAMYPGSSRLLARVTFVSGSPSEAADLIRAGVMTARSAVVLTNSKPAASADGGDNLSDDTDAIVTTSTIFKLNPALHVITELLHGAHAPFLRPTGATLNDAQRSSFVWILEEREAMRQRAKLEDAIRRLGAQDGPSPPPVPTPHSAAGAVGGPDPWDVTAPSTPSSVVGMLVRAPLRAAVLLTKLSKQQLRLKATSSAFTKRLGAPPPPSVSGGGGPLPRTGSSSSNNSRGGGGADLRGAMAELDATAPMRRGARSSGGAAGGVEDSDADLERLASSGLSNSAIVDVLVGVREEFGASAAANEGAAFSMGGVGAGAAAGASKGSGATNDLFASPAFAAGRVFSLNTMDSLLLEAHFSPFVPSVLKQLARAARRQRLVALPVTDAIVMAQLVLARGSAGVAELTPAVLRAARDNYLSDLATRILGAARGGGVVGPGPHQAGEQQQHVQQSPASSASVESSGPSGGEDVHTYGVVCEALLRGWNLLPIGLYRRLHPASGLKASVQTVAALQMAAGPPLRGEEIQHNRALLSFVHTNPPPSVKLAEHDLIYVLRPDVGGEEDD